MEPSTEGNAELRARVRQQGVVAELSQQALETGDLDRLMGDAAAAVAETLDADLCAVFEPLPDADEAVLRRGVGWRDGLIGAATVSTAPDSQVGYTLHRESPTTVGDASDDDDRFSMPELLASHGVAAGIGAVVGSPDDPWGVLGVYATEPREFSDTDPEFVRSVANVLASAVENRRNRSELEEIYGRISDAFFALDREWRFTFLNERAHELINPEGRTLVGEHIWDAFPEGIGGGFKSEYERAMYEQETVSFEEYYPEPLDAWFEVRAYPSETGLSVYFRDVTERRERESEFRRTQRRFEAIFEDPNILVGLLDPDGTVLDINQTAMEYVDADLQAVRGELFWETPWWGEGDDVSEAVREWTERAAAGEYVDFEADLTRPDGERYTLSGVFRPVTNDDGEVVSIVVSDRDITERKERERALEESEQRYRTLAESFPNGLVALFDDDLRYTLAAGQGFEDLPVSPADVEGRTPSEAWNDEVADALVPLLEATLDGEKGSVELEYYDREWVIHAVPITDKAGDVFAGMTMAQDITERKEYQRRLEETVEDLEESNETLENFASMLAHELRNPVTIGQIYSQQLPADADSEAVEYVTEAFDRIEDMIDVMLVLTRGREAVSAGDPVDLSAVARAAWADIDAPEAALDVDMDWTIRADETYVRHLFRNLFENAVEHGGQDVTVTVGELSDGSASGMERSRGNPESSRPSGDEVSRDATDRSSGRSRREGDASGGSTDGRVGGFYVADDGSGIPPEKRERVFEEGYTTSAEQGGTGLGLAFVKELADAYEWDCSVTESAGGGAKIEFANVE